MQQHIYKVLDVLFKCTEPLRGASVAYIGRFGELFTFLRGELAADRAAALGASSALLIETSFAERHDLAVEPVHAFVERHAASAAANNGHVSFDLPRDRGYGFSEFLRDLGK